ncbi:MAG: hypothetical protein HKP09_08185, partial [Enterobacterales bacterium]|nr:hypothetical protein [Enterobacterales bacterium]
VIDDKTESQGVALTEDHSFTQPDHHPYEEPQSYPELMYMNGVLQPRWAEEEFEVVIVETAGLRIAVPVFSLGAIQSLSESNLDVKNKPKNSALFIGTAEFNHIHYPVIDSCRWFMPEQYTELSNDSLDYGYYLTHTKSHYALAVNAVHTSIMLSKDDIKWGKLHTKRPWLAGMLKNQRAILVELDMLMPHIAETLR